MKCAIWRRDSFYRGDAFTGNGANRNTTRAGNFAIYMYAAGTTCADAAAELCAGQLELVADYPEEWGIRIRLDRQGLAVDLKIDGHKLTRAAEALLDIEREISRCGSYSKI